MHSPSRRAFLRGRRAANTPWGQFCLRLRRSISGTLHELEPLHNHNQARLQIQRASDIHHAMALCREYGVALALDGIGLRHNNLAKPVLWVVPGGDSSSFYRLEEGGSRWFVQPGCTMGSLAAAGFTAFGGLPASLTIAAWVADRTYSDYATGCTHNSGIDHAKLLLGDSNSLSLGPFGAQNTKPLEGWHAQQLVSALFRLISSSEAKACLAQAKWPARYRLDALANTSEKGINLAHLLLGHGGSLGWLEWLVIDVNKLKPVKAPEVTNSLHEAKQHPYGTQQQARFLDQKVKSLFDPGNVLA